MWCIFEYPSQFIYSNKFRGVEWEKYVWKVVSQNRKHILNIFLDGNEKKNSHFLMLDNDHLYVQSYYGIYSFVNESKNF